MPAIVFPATSSPGIEAGEHAGRLINAYAEPAPAGARGTLRHRRVPGLVEHADTTGNRCRGMIEVDDLIYAAFDNRCYKITEGGTATLLGTLPGTGPVYFARNQRTPTPQIYAVAEASEHLVTSTGITQVVLGTRGLSNSVAFLNGYFIVTRSDGTWGVSAINDVTFSDLDTAAAEGSPDKLVRVIAHKGDALLFGRKSLEVWQDVGASPGIPFQRVALKNIGLLSGPAVAGNEPGWADVLIFVASDGSVRRLDGYEPVRIPPTRLTATSRPLTPRRWRRPSTPRAGTSFGHCRPMNGRGSTT